MRLIDADKLLVDIEKYHLSDGKFQHWVQIQNTIEPEKCEDTVSRNAVIQKLNTMDRYVSEELRLCDTDKIFPKNEVFIVDDVYEEIVEDLPSAQPEPQWIPCSGTIDIPHHEVLCCDRYGEELIGWLSYVDDQWLCESDGEMMYDPVAWREKPEPYKEGQDG